MAFDFDSARLPNPHLTEEHELLRTQLRRFIDVEVMPYAADWDEQCALPNDLWPKAAAAGVRDLATRQMGL